MAGAENEVSAMVDENPQRPPRVRAPRVNGHGAGYRHLLWARILELKREPEVVFWAFIFPLLLAVGLGIAFRSTPASATSVVVIDGPGAQKTVALLQGTSNQDRAGTHSSVEIPSDSDHANRKVAIRLTVLDRKNALEAFQLHKFDLVIEPKPNGSYTYHYDPARVESMLSRVEVDFALQSAAGRKDAVATSSQLSNEPGSRYIDFLLPGLLGMKLASSGMWGVGLTLVEMRQRRLLKRFVATPMRRTDFLLAIVSSRLILMLIEMGLLLGFGVLVFHMPIQGSILSLLLLGCFGGITFGGVGLLAACRAQKIESVSGAINLIAMPMWIFSGVFFSYQRFPEVVQPFIKALPLTALNDALRATIIEGASLASQSHHLFILALWACLSFTVALRRFRWS